MDSLSGTGNINFTIPPEEYNIDTEQTSEVTTEENKEEEFKNQHVSIRYLDIEKIESYFPQTLVEIPLLDMVNKVIDVYNARHKKNVSEHYLQDDEVTKWQPSTAHGFNIAVYYREMSYLSTFSAFLKDQGSSKKYENMRYDFIIFLFRKIGEKREIFGLTTGHGWYVISPFTNFRFSTQITKLLVDPNHIKSHKLIHLVGESSQSQKVYRLDPKIIQSTFFTSKVIYLRGIFKETASVYQFIPESKPGSVQVEITVGQIRIIHRIGIKSFPPILDLFSKIIRGEATYCFYGNQTKRRRTIEENDPIFEFLDYVERIDDKVQRQQLDALLIMKFCEAFNARRFPDLYLGHRYSNDFANSNEHLLTIKGEEFNWTTAPTFEEIVPIITKYFPSLDTDSFQLIKYQYFRTGSGMMSKEACLADFFEGDVINDKKSYVKVLGEWYQTSADYLNLVHNDFKTLIKDHLTPPGTSGYLTRPWRLETGMVDSDITPALLKSVNNKTFKTLFEKLKEEFAFIDKDGAVIYRNLSGQILEEPLIVKYQDRLKAILKANKTLILSTLVLNLKIPVKDAQAIIKSLKARRKTIETDLHNQRWYVINPFIPDNLRSSDRELLKKLQKILDDRYEQRQLYGSQDRTSEGKYNESYSDDLNFFVGDRVLPKNIELGDIFYHDKDTIKIFHVKIGLTHDTRVVASQIINAALGLYARMPSKGDNILKKFWDLATTYSGNTPYRLTLQKKLLEMKEDNFYDLFNKKKIIFVLAFVDDHKEECLLSDETAKVNVKDTIDKSDWDNLIQLGLIDKDENVTKIGSSISETDFVSQSQDKTWKTKDMFSKLRVTKFNSNIAKLELIHLKRSLSELGFGFQIYQIPRATETIPLTQARDENHISSQDLDEGGKIWWIKKSSARSNIIKANGISYLHHREGQPCCMLLKISLVMIKAP